MAQKKSEAAKSIPKKSVGNKVSIGFGLTAAAATVAGAYFLYGSKKASQNRKKVKSWTLKAKAEVLEGLEKAEQLTEDDYKKLVETATGLYGTVKDVTKGEVVDFKKEMLTHWTDLQKNTAVRKLVGAAAKKMVAKTVAPKAPAKKAAPAKKVAKVATPAPKAAPAKKAAAKASPKKSV